MFGRYAISKAPFAGQGSSAYFLSLTEDASLADAATDTAAFSLSITQGVTIADTNAQQDVFYFGNVDAVFHSDDTENATVNFPLSFSDGVSCAETIGITAQFKGSVTEAMTSLDTLSGGVIVFFTIDEDSGLSATPTASHHVDRSITEGFSSADAPLITAQFVVSRSDAMGIAVHLETFGWIKIQTHTTSNWTPIDDAQ